MAWVLMPDHAHWLLQLGTESLGRVVARMKSAVSRNLHSQWGDAGPVWSNAFHDRAIRRDEDLHAAARYVVANPLRAGLCRSLGDYPFWDAVWLAGNEGEIQERACWRDWRPSGLP
ncbi:REP element-mobilizing transposase RayT [Luteimonas sp. 3794]|nr:REP element-mobilizing transposase RayT [Luteimonas sp. 3794]